MTGQLASSEAVRFSPRRLGHVNLFVGDLDRSMRFYHEVCGIEEVAREPGIGAGFLSNGNTHHDIGLIQVTEGQILRGRGGHLQIPEGRGERAGLNHLGWELENEVQLVAAYRRAQASALPIHRLADHQISHSVYLFDPDGNLHEFYADAMKDWRGFFQGELDLLTGEWTPEDPPASPEPKYHANPEIRRVEDALVHSLRTTHAVLVAQDFQSMRDFLTDVAGLSIVYSAPDKHCLCLRGANSERRFDVALIAATGRLEPGLHHFAFELIDASELDAAEQALVKAGLEIDTREDNSAKRSVFLRDPDGLRVEFFARRCCDFSALDAAPPERRPYLV